VLLAAGAAELHDAVLDGAPLPALVLAGALFGYALHACLAEATRPAIVMLGAAAALLALAEPAWLPGALVVLLIVALTRAVRPHRLKIAGAGLLAVLVCLVPHLASTASQNEGRPFADMDARAVTARNAEFAGDGHGAPTAVELSRDPLSGRPVDLAGYLFSDHSASQFAGGALAGGQDSITAFNQTADAGVLGILAFVVAAAGALFVLLLERLRLLVLLAPLVVAPTLFIAANTAADPAAAGAVLWPVMLACAGILAYTGARLAHPLLEPYLETIARVRARIRVPRLPRAAATPDRKRT
ncbi:MAG: hypothetical protein ACRDLS_01515, partial [Solirubrobacteraceae bacterium]